MTDQHHSLAPSNPYQWHESVLSTRSLSYMSTVSALGGHPLPSPLTSRNASIVHMYPPPDPMDEDSDYELELPPRRTERREEILPDSVVRSLLFCLPREIRDRIYSYCLTLTERPYIQWPTPSPFNTALSPELLRTCKIIHQEATSILYLHNAFMFTHPSDANIFVRTCTDPRCSNTITTLHLTLDVRDTRLWLTYINCSTAKRSLRTDFPNLRDLTIRYRSNKWIPSHNIDHNMRAWWEDRHLDELIDVLRSIYYPPFRNIDFSGLDEKQVKQVKDYEDEESATQEALRDELVVQRLREVRRTQAQALNATKALKVKVICVCKVPPHHFQLLVEPPEGIDMHTAGGRPGNFAVAGMALNHAAQAQGLPPLVPSLIRDPAEAPPDAIVEGQEFVGFSYVDFKGRGTRVGNRPVARTVFANRKNIMIALEVMAPP